MRNTLADARWARWHKQKRAAFGLVYVAGEQFPMSSEVADPDSEWSGFVEYLRPKALLTVKGIAYQCLLEIWRRNLPEDEVLAVLTNWVDEKVDAVQQVTG